MQPNSKTRRDRAYSRTDRTRTTDAKRLTKQRRAQRALKREGR